MNKNEYSDELDPGAALATTAADDAEVQEVQAIQVPKTKHRASKTWSTSMKLTAMRTANSIGYYQRSFISSLKPEDAIGDGDLPKTTAAFDRKLADRLQQDEEFMKGAKINRLVNDYVFSKIAATLKDRMEEWQASGWKPPSDTGAVAKPEDEKDLLEEMDSYLAQYVELLTNHGDQSKGPKKAAAVKLERKEKERAKKVQEAMAFGAQDDRAENTFRSLKQKAKDYIAEHNKLGEPSAFFLFSWPFQKPDLDADGEHKLPEEVVDAMEAFLEGLDDINQHNRDTMPSFGGTWFLADESFDTAKKRCTIQQRRGWKGKVNYLSITADKQKRKRDSGGGPGGFGGTTIHDLTQPSGNSQKNERQRDELAHELKWMKQWHEQQLELNEQAQRHMRELMERNAQENRAMMQAMMGTMMQMMANIVPSTQGTGAPQAGPGPGSSG
mmetsp:Transcript_29379/g.78940  ORF Transcript_29379/g.78940 Transcript_29379/m.78940 type:complete len:441 (+) Transcript_29379:72-1394(+)